MESAQINSFAVALFNLFASLEKLPACRVIIKNFFIISPQGCFGQQTSVEPAHNHPVLPQQDPGPAQCAWDGELPQQAVSPGPGKSLAFRPVRELVVDINRFVRALPQLGQIN